MSWIEELDKYGQNFLIDELVWHLEKGRMPVSILMECSTGRTGIVFHFESAEPAFLSVPERMLHGHWREAQEILSEFGELRYLRYMSS